MVGLFALITLAALVIRSRSHGDAWLIAILTGIRRGLLGVLAGYGMIVALAVGLGAAHAIVRPITDAAVGMLPEGQPPASRASGLPAIQATRIPATVTSTLPTPTPRVVKLAYAIPTPQVATTITATPPVLVTPATSTPTPAPLALRSADERTGCDPAYPDSRTCIPPGPPWDQGCGITEERRFTVVSPDPQGLDHDNDGIGCEPIA